MADRRKPRWCRGGAVLALFLLAAACSENELILPGEREPIRPVDPSLQIAADAGADGTQGAVPVSAVAAPVVPLTVPPSRMNSDWTHLSGDATHLAPSAALAATPTLRWSTSIGEGSDRRVRLTAAPVIAGGRIFAMDTAGRVTALSATGQRLWQTALRPPREGSFEGFGGGLAAADGALVAATGFGEVLRLDPATGAILWRTPVEGAVRAAPSLSGDIVVAVARGELGYGLDLATGEIEWRLEGAGLGAGLIGGGSPAVRGPLAVLPFQSGEVRGVLLRNGLTVWNAALTGGRRGAVRATINDISGDPVIDNDIVYIGNQGGRVAALDRRSGARIWATEEGAYGPILPVGGSVFLVSDRADLLRLSAGDGSVIWRQPLPEYKDGKRSRGAVTHFGPLLAGGRLIVASGDGGLRSFDPVTGAPLGLVALPGGAATQPALANGWLYVLTGNGTLHAFQ